MMVLDVNVAGFFFYFYNSGNMKICSKLINGSLLSVPFCLLIPRVIVLVRAAVLRTVSPVFKLASVGLRGCVQSQAGVQLCSQGSS